MESIINQCVCTYGTHLNREVIFIQIPNKETLKQELKSLLPFVKWSRTNRKWYILDTNPNRKSLRLPPKLYSGKDILLKLSAINQPHFKRFIEQLRLKAYSENTIKTYTVEFAQWLYVLNNFDAALIQQSHLRSYLVYCMKDLKLSENQIHSRMNAMKFFYEKVLNKHDFFIEIPRPKKKNALPKVFSIEEIKSIFNATNNRKHLLILKTAYGLGLRVSEIADLKITDIDSKRMLIHIQNSKGKKDRYVPLPQTLLNELRVYYIEYRPKTYVFENQQHQKLSIRTLQLLFKNTKDKAKINKNIGIHGLRHSYATHLLEYGTDMSVIQKLLGHNHVKTTQVYAKISNTYLHKIISPLDEMYK